LVEHVHGEEAARQEEGGGEERGAGGKALGQAATAQRARHQPGRQHQGGVGEGRQDVERERRVAQGARNQGGQPGDQGRVIDVAPIRVQPAGDEVVQLVAEVAIGLGEGQMRDQGEEGQRREQGGGAWRDGG